MSAVPAHGEILTRAQVEQTCATIVAMQEPSGAIPWTPGEHTDVWNHLESAMALMVGGQRDAAYGALNDLVPCSVTDSDDRRMKNGPHHLRKMAMHSTTRTSTRQIIYSFQSTPP